MKKVCVFKFNDNKCSILKDKKCMRCHFFKTAEELAEGREKARKRLESLPPSTRLKIRIKYIENNEELESK